MNGLLGALGAVFWGLILLSVLVFVHEGGHFMAARALGIRVKEFYLGLPCRFNLHHESRRYGTDYGVTPVLLGGYTLVCGMEGDATELSAPVLAYVQEKGTVLVDEVAERFGCTADDAVAVLASLSDWAAIEPFYDPALGERPNQSTYPSKFRTLARDPELRTKYDRGHDFSLPGSTEAGEPHPVAMGQDAFLQRERAHTYQAHGFWGRTFVLVSGVLVNVLCGLLLVVAVLTLHGVTVSDNSGLIGAVQEGSIAQAAGLEAGDRIVAVDGAPVSTWTDMSAALHTHLSQGEDFTVTYERDGKTAEAGISLDGPVDRIGISSAAHRQRLSVPDALAYAVNYVGATAVYVSQLFQPAHIGSVIENSTSVVGISVMASRAASEGLASFALLAAAVSLSLGFMNLLPVPPLDGGKIVIEAVQALIRRPVPLRVQAYISYVGIALFMLLFFVLLRQDIIRFVMGG